MNWSILQFTNDIPKRQWELIKAVVLNSQFINETFLKFDPIISQSVKVTLLKTHPWKLLLLKQIFLNDDLLTSNERCELFHSPSLIVQFE